MSPCSLANIFLKSVVDYSGTVATVKCCSCIFFICLECENQDEKLLSRPALYRRAPHIFIVIGTASTCWNNLYTGMIKFTKQNFKRTCTRIFQMFKKIKYLIIFSTAMMLTHAIYCSN